MKKIVMMSIMAKFHTKYGMSEKSSDLISVHSIDNMVDSAERLHVKLPESSETA